MKVNNVYCLFEQSGAFRNYFRSLHIPAYDYDIENSFSCTDVQCDLFSEIEKAYIGESSCFDSFSSGDLIFAFFPCTRFESQCQLLFSGNSASQSSWSDIQKVLYVKDLHVQLSGFYSSLCKLLIVCLRRELRLVIENPYNKGGYLFKYFPIKPSIIIPDRSLFGDYFIKPTAFWFINCSPELNYLPECRFKSSRFRIDNLSSDDLHFLGCNDVKTARSLISPEFVSWFCRSYILSEV